MICQCAVAFIRLRGFAAAVALGGDSLTPVTNFALEMRYEHRPPTRAAFGLTTPDGSAVLAWDSQWPTIAHYTDLGVVDILHGQDAPPDVRTRRHHLVDLAADPDGLATAQQVLRRHVPTLYLTGAEAVEHGGIWFALERGEDVTGISGTGTVAYGLATPSGAVVLSWISPWKTVAAYPNLAAVTALHGHDGRTRVVPLDTPADSAGAEALLRPQLPLMSQTASAAAILLGMYLPDLLAHAPEQAEKAKGLVDSLQRVRAHDGQERDGYAGDRHLEAALQELKEAQALLPRHGNLAKIRELFDDEQ
jgi:hypothetical protein